MAKNEEIMELKTGNLTNLQLDKWIKNMKMDYLYATIEGAQKSKDVNCLLYLTRYTIYSLSNPQNVAYREYYIALIKSIINAVATLDLKDSYHIVMQLYTSPIDDIRLYCAACLDYRLLVSDSCKRVQKIAQARYSVAIKMREEKNKARVLFLKDALDYGLIECSAVTKTPEGAISLVLTGKLIKMSNILVIDADIYELIADKTILASALDDYVQSGDIILDEDFARVLNGQERKREKIASNKRSY